MVVLLGRARVVVIPALHCMAAFFLLALIIRSLPQQANVGDTIPSSLGRRDVAWNETHDLLALVEGNWQQALQHVRVQNWVEAWRLLQIYPSELLRTLSLAHRSKAAAVANTYAYVMMEVGADLDAAHELARWSYSLRTTDEGRAISLICVGLIEAKHRHFNTSILSFSHALKLLPPGRGQAQVNYNIIQSVVDGYFDGGANGEGVDADALGLAVLHAYEAIELYKRHANGAVPHENRYHFSRAVNSLLKALSRSDAATAKVNRDRLSATLAAFGSANWEVHRTFAPAD